MLMLMLGLQSVRKTKTNLCACEFLSFWWLSDFHWILSREKKDTEKRNENWIWRNSWHLKTIIILFCAVLDSERKKLNKIKGKLVKWTKNGSVLKLCINWLEANEQGTIRCLFGDEAEKLVLIFFSESTLNTDHKKKTRFVRFVVNFHFSDNQCLKIGPSRAATFLNVQIDKRPWYTDKKTFHSILILNCEKSLLFLKFVPRSGLDIQTDSILCRF